MLSKKITALALLFAFLALPLAFADDSDAAGGLKLVAQDIRTGVFVENSAGDMTVVIENTSENDIRATVYVTYLNSDGRLASRDVTVPAEVDDKTPGRAEVTLSFRIGSPGTHWVEVWVTYMSIQDPGNTDPDWVSEEVKLRSGSLEVNVVSSIWNNTSTYIVIIAVIIIVGIAVWLRMRNPSRKNEVAAGMFTAMEARKREARKKQAEPDEQSWDEEDDEDLEEEKTAVPAVAAAEKNKKKNTAKAAEKKEYTGKVSSTKKKPSQPQRKSNPQSRKSSKRR